MPSSKWQDVVAPETERSILKSVLKIVEDQHLIAGKYGKDEPVVEFLKPKDLEQRLDLVIGKKGTDLDILEDICAQAAKYSVKTCSANFYNQLYHGVDEFGLAGSWLSDALNTNNYTFEVAPVFILAERVVLQYIRQKFGWTSGDGIFCPGGSISNMYGLILARHKMFPDIKVKGLVATAKPLVVFTSEESHYSLVKGANWLGIGTENVIKIRTNQQGQMIPSALEQAIKEAKARGQAPFFVNATAGSTVMGAYDDLEVISRICQRFGLWMHVDACWGGSVVMSSKHKHLMSGSHKADSIAWNPHKMLARGENYMENLVNNAFDQAEYFMSLISSTPGFRPAFDFGFSCTNVCFEYVPMRLRGDEEDEDWEDELALIPPKLKEIMIKKGTLMIGYQPLTHKEKKNFFRMVVHCVPPPTKEDMEYVIQNIDLYGKDL
eukprot:snap_masked-scaffold1459_size40432-processed-gene-0.1 protein:Tk02618 transcript:snap_masked-scaffold1459_size40432-processed-gene-0.1-mRNA-1 annotation:"isoform cra_a"